MGNTSIRQRQALYLLTLSRRASLCIECGGEGVQHVPQREHEQVWAIDAADGAARSARICLLAAGAAIALDLGSGAAPLLTVLVAAEGALLILVCSCFDSLNVLRRRSRNFV